MTKLIFMGTPDFSATVLKGLLADSRYEILAVVTQPDRKVGRKKEIRMTPVKQVALEHQLPCLLYTSPSPRDMRRSRMPSSA